MDRTFFSSTRKAEGASLLIASTGDDLQREMNAGPKRLHAETLWDIAHCTTAPRGKSVRSIIA
jgi:hypothetical protein